MSKVLTDNSYFSDKVQLRIESLPDKKNINILECFSGDGKIWDSIKKGTDKKFTILKIEKEVRGGYILKVII